MLLQSNSGGRLNCRMLFSPAKQTKTKHGQAFCRSSLLFASNRTRSVSSTSISPTTSCKRPAFMSCGSGSSSAANLKSSSKTKNNVSGSHLSSLMRGKQMSWTYTKTATFLTNPPHTQTYKGRMPACANGWRQAQPNNNMLRAASVPPPSKDRDHRLARRPSGRRTAVADQRPERPKLARQVCVEVALRRQLMRQDERLLCNLKILVHVLHATCCKVRAHICARMHKHVFTCACMHQHMHACQCKSSEAEGSSEIAIFD